MRKSTWFHIDKQSADPIYQQLIEQIKQGIVKGELVSGMVLPSIRTLAKQLQINPMTASKAYSLLEREGTVERIHGKGVRIAGVSPPHPQGTVRTKTRLVGLIFHEIAFTTHPYFPPLLHGINEVCKAKDYSIQLCPIRHESIFSRENVFLATLLDRALFDGLLLLSALSMEDIQLLQRKQVPFVVQNNEYPDLDVPCVVLDAEQQVIHAIEHLVRRHHQRIGLITGPSRYEWSPVITGAFRAAKAFQQGLASRGLPVEDRFICHIPWERDKARQATEQLLSYDDRPTGLIVSGNYQAEGALEAIHHKGLHIPEDIEIVQIMSENGKGSPGLILQSNLFEMGKRSMEMLVEWMEKGTVSPKRQMVEFTVVEGEAHAIMEEVRAYCDVGG